jgi:hypothetical protein
MRMSAAGTRASTPDHQRSYLDLVDGGLTIWPELRWAREDVAEWAEALIRHAQLDGLRAELTWLHQHDVFLHPAVVLLRPDGSLYDHPYANHWPDLSQPPPSEPAVGALHPLVEEDWGRTLARARARAGRAQPR